MSKSIASIVLVGIKKKEAEQRQNERDKVYEALEYYFSQLVKNHVLPNETSDNDWHFKFENFDVLGVSFPTIQSALQSFGCMEVKVTIFRTSFSVPMWNKGNKKSPAQMLVFNYIKRTKQWQKEEKIKENKKITGVYNAAMDKLKKNEFASISSDNGKYEIKVEMGLPVLSNEGIEKLSKMFLRRKFTLMEYSTRPNFIRLAVYK